MSSNKKKPLTDGLQADRRKFLINSLIGGISFLSLPLNLVGSPSANPPVKYKLSLDRATRYFDGETCFVHPRAGIVPLAGKNGMPRIVMTMTTLDLSGSDVFQAAYGMQTDDLGETWTNPTELKSLGPHYEIIDGLRRPVALSDFWPMWHKH